MEQVTVEVATSVRVEWERLCQQLQLSSDVTETWWREIEGRYSEPHRHYHTLSHLADMFRHQQHLHDSSAQTTQVALAIFFHDIIYDPKAADNEEKSAELFKTFARECSLKSDGISAQAIYDMILSTKTHSTPAHTDTQSRSFGCSEVHYLLDLDMAILGQPPDIYRRYATAIRQEYIHIPDEQYYYRRSQVLKSFLQTPRIFCTEYFHMHYEQQARENIQQEIYGLAM